MHQDATWYGGRPQPRKLCVTWDPALLPKMGQSPQFWAHVYCDQTAGWIKMALGKEVDIGPDDIVLDGDPAPPQFSAHIYCDQTAGWIKMALGMEVGLGPGHIVLDGHQAPLPKKGQSPPQFSAQASLLHGTQPPPQKGAENCRGAPPGQSPLANFGPFLLWSNGWMHQDATWYGERPQPRRLCVRWGRSPLPQKGWSLTQFSAHVYCGQTAAWIKMPLGTEVGLDLRDSARCGSSYPRKKGTPTPPNFRPTSIVAKQLYGSRYQLVRTLF